MAKETNPKKEKVAKAAPESKGKKQAAGQEKGVTARLFERYRKETIPSMMKKFQYKSKMQISDTDNSLSVLSMLSSILFKRIKN